MAGPRSDLLLEVRDLETHFETQDGTVRAVDGASLEIRDGQTLGVVGESGCGKSVTALSVMRLIERPGKIVHGEIRLRGRDLLRASDGEMRDIRGGTISMIFQEPMTSLNPVFPCGDQIAERPWIAPSRCSARSASRTRSAAPGSIPTSSPAGCASA